MLREAVLLIALALAAAVPSAFAQEEPTVNESDFNTTDPESDESYLGEGSGNETTSDNSTSGNSTSNDTTEDPTLDESELDTTAPPVDESYLDDAEREIGGADAAAESPGLPLVGALAALAVATVVLRRR